LSNPARHELTHWIKERAQSVGFEACGIVQASFLDQDAARLEQWLEKGYQAGMSYMERNRDKRSDPRILMPGARSVIVVLMNYFPAENIRSENNYKIAKYAYGKDYHYVIREKLNRLIDDIQDLAGAFQARAFTDSAPVMERAWAEKAGLGRIGKNTCLIHPKLGSFVFIGEIITDLDLDYDHHQINDLCGGCTRCIEACPTGALTGPRSLDSNKCISYLTIEHKDEIPESMSGKFHDWIFGCDICQDVCPWNRKAAPGKEASFKLSDGLKEMDKALWENLSEENFTELFRKSAVKRTKFTGLKRNIAFLKKDEKKE
jgi:epoxyqueuosine reductase